MINQHFAICAYIICTYKCMYVYIYICNDIPEDTESPIGCWPWVAGISTPGIRVPRYTEVMAACGIGKSKKHAVILTRFLETSREISPSKSTILLEYC